MTNWRLTAAGLDAQYEHECRLIVLFSQSRSQSPTLEWPTSIRRQAVGDPHGVERPR